MQEDDAEQGKARTGRLRGGEPSQTPEDVQSQVGIHLHAGETRGCRPTVVAYGSQVVRLYGYWEGQRRNISVVLYFYTVIGKDYKEGRSSVVVVVVE